MNLILAKITCIINENGSLFTKNKMDRNFSVYINFEYSYDLMNHHYSIIGCTWSITHTNNHGSPFCTRGWCEMVSTLHGPMRRDRRPHRPDGCYELLGDVRIMAWLVPWTRHTNSKVRYATLQYILFWSRHLHILWPINVFMSLYMLQYLSPFKIHVSWLNVGTPRLRTFRPDNDWTNVEESIAEGAFGMHSFDDLTAFCIKKIHWNIECG
jgi:hypothetical protein